MKKKKVDLKVSLVAISFITLTGFLHQKLGIDILYSFFLSLVSIFFLSRL